MFTGYLSNGKKRIACLIVLALFISLLITPGITALAEENAVSADSSGTVSNSSDNSGSPADSSGGEAATPLADVSGGDTIQPPTNSGDEETANPPSGSPGNENPPTGDATTPQNDTKNQNDQENSSSNSANTTDQTQFPSSINNDSGAPSVPSSIESISTTEEIYNAPSSQSIIDDIYSTDMNTVVAVYAPPSAPVADKLSGTYLPGTAVTLTTNSLTASIYYTIDNSDPETNGVLYTAPLTLNNSCKLQVVAQENGQSSEIAVYDYEVKQIIFDEWDFTNDGVITTDNWDAFEINASFQSVYDISSIGFQCWDEEGWYALPSSKIIEDSGLIHVTETGKWSRTIVVDFGGIDIDQLKIRVVAADNQGSILPADETLTIEQPVNGVSNLTVVPNADESGLVLTWTNPPENFYRAKIYKLYDYGEGTEWSYMDRVYGNTWTDYDVESGVTYTYLVEAYDYNYNKFPDVAEASGKINAPNGPQVVSLTFDNNGIANINNHQYYYIHAYYRAQVMPSVGFELSTDGTNWQPLTSSSAIVNNWPGEPYYESWSRKWRFEIELNLSSLPDGQYLVRTTATAEGVTTQPLSASFKKDTVLPTVTGLTVTPNAENNALVLSWINVDDFERAIVSKLVYDYYHPNGYWNTLNYNVTINSYTDIDVEPYQTVSYKVECFDKAGNRDTNPPVVVGALTVEPIMFEEWNLDEEDWKITFQNEQGFQAYAFFLAAKQIVSIDFTYSEDGVNWMSLEPYMSENPRLERDGTENRWYRYVRINVGGPLGLPDGTYYLRATATDIAGNSCSSQHQVIKDATPPPDVTDFTVAPNAENNALVLTWTNPSDCAFVRIKRDDSYISGDLVANTYTDINVEPGITYNYKVLTVDEFGNETKSAQIISGTIPVGAPLLFTMYPSDQQGFNGDTLGYSASFADDKQITSISFSLSSDETTWTPLPSSYDPVRFNNPRYDNNGSWNISKIGNATYKIRVIATDVDGRSTTVIRTVYVLHKAPAVPTNFAAAVNTAAPSVSLSWDMVSGASKYRITRYYANGSYGYGSDYWTINAPNTTYLDTVLQVGKAYKYSIQAIDQAGNYSDYAYVNADVQGGLALSLNGGLERYVNNTAYTLSGQTEPGAAVTVNGNLLTVNADGTFTYSATLTSSETTFNIAAKLSGSTHTVMQKVILDSVNPSFSYMYIRPSDINIVCGSSQKIEVRFYDDMYNNMARAVLQISTDDGVSWTDVGSVQTGSGFIYWDTTAFADGNYKVRAVGYDKAGNLGTSPVRIWKIDNIAPVAPHGLTAAPALTQVSLTWQGNTEPDLDKYNIYRSTISSTGYSILTNVAKNVTSYIDKENIQNGLTYYYVLTAVDTAGNESPYSAEVSSQPQTDNVGPTITNYQFKDNSGEKIIGGKQQYMFINATENSFKGVKSFIFSYSGDGGSTWKSSIYSASNSWGSYSTSFYWTLTGLSEGPYLIRYSAQDYYGNSTSVEVPVTLDLSVNAPLNVSARSGEGSVILAWDPPVDADLDHYTIERSTFITNGFEQKGSSITKDVYTYTDADPTLQIGRTYYYRVVSYDKYGNSKTSSVVSGKPTDDMTPPVVSNITTPYILGGPATSFQGYASDNRAVTVMDAVYSTDDGVTWKTMSVSKNGPYKYGSEYYTDFTWYTTGLSSGTYKIKVTARDAVGNEGTMETSWTLDFSVTAPTNLQATAGDAEIVLTWDKVMDADLNEYQAYRILRGDKPGSYYEIGYTDKDTASYTDTGMLPGTNYYYVVASCDRYGNTARSGERAVTSGTDTTPPYIIKVDPPTGVTIGGAQTQALKAYFRDNYPINNSHATFEYSNDGTTWNTIMANSSWLYRDYNTGEDYLYAPWDLRTLNSGTYSVRYCVYDGVGNFAQQVVNYQVDRTAPGTPGNLIAIYGSGCISLAWQAPPDADIEKYVIYRANDSAGPYDELATVIGRSEIRYTDLTIASELTYFYKVKAVDKFYQESSFSNIAKAAAKTDNILPTIDGIDPADNTLLGPQAAVTVIARDNQALSSITLQYSADQGTTWNDINTIATQERAVFNWSTAPLNGSIQVRAIARDASNNASDGTLVRTYNIDTQGPAKITGVVYQSFITSVLLNWNDVPDRDFDYFQVESKTSAEGQYTTAGKVSTARGLQVNSLKPATDYWFRVVAYDKLGNRGTVSDDVMVVTADDNVKPELRTFSPGSGAPASRSLRIYGSASDNVGVSQVSIQHSTDQANWSGLFEKTYDNPTTSADFDYTWDVSGLQEGKRYVRCIVSDLAGNTQTSGIYEYVIDHTPPAKPTGLTFSATAGYISVSWPKNPEKDLASYKVYRGQQASGPYQLKASGYNYLLYIDRNVSAGTVYYYKVVAVDLVENESEASDAVSASLVADTSSPVINSVKPSSNRTLPANPILSIYSADDYMVSKVTADYQKDGSGSTWSPIGSKNPNVYAEITDIKWQTEGLIDGKYIVRAMAWDASGNTSVPSYVYYTLNTSAPAVPVLTAVSGGWEVDLSWTSGHESDLAGFYVLRKSGSGQFQSIKRLTGTSFTDTPLEPAVKYTYKIQAVDMYGNISESSEVSSTPTDEDSIPPVADIGDDQVITVGMEAGFDGTYSTDNNRIAAYFWDFGDGNKSTIAQPAHAYSEAGTYTVSLTVYDPAGLGSTDSCQVQVVPPQQVGTLEVRVVDDVNGNTLPGASVLIQFPDGSSQKSTSNAQGVAYIVAGAGDYKIYAYKEDYKPASINATLKENQTSTADVRLKRGQIVTGEMNVRRMTLDEITAAGIDVNDPANQFIYKFEVHLAFSNEPFELITNGEGGILGGADGGDGCPEISFTDEDGEEMKLYPVVIPNEHPEARPTLAYLVIPGQASWLKEFFEVSLTLENTADPEFVIDSARAELRIPEGLSLAPTRERQRAQVELGSIAGGEKRQVKWIIRGDQKGYYNLQANFNGILQPFGDPIGTIFQTKEPFRVWGGDALKMHIVAQDRSDNNHPYNVRFGLENVSDGPVYNLSLELKDKGKQNYIYAPNQELKVFVQELSAGQTLWKDYQLVPSIDGKLELGYSYVLQTGGNTEVESDFASITVPENVKGTAPVLSQVNSGGKVNLSWPKVEGALGYKIYRVRDDLMISRNEEMVYEADPGETSVELPEPLGSKEYIINTICDTVYGQQEIMRHAMSGTNWQKNAGLPVITIDPEEMPVNWDANLTVTVNNQGFPVAGGTINVGNLQQGLLLDENGQVRITVHPIEVGDLTVEAYDSEGNYLCSTVINVFTPAAPAAPTGLKATLVDGVAKLEWNENTERNLTGYNVYQYINNDWKKLNSEVIDTSVYSIYGLTEGSYFFEVKAVNTWNLESEPSDPAKVEIVVHDTVAPWIVSTSPTKGKVNVPQNVQFNAVFSEAVQAGPGFAGITVKAGNSPVQFGASTVKKYLMLNLLNNLPANTICTVTIPAEAVMDSSGNKLAKGDSFSFITGNSADRQVPIMQSTNPTMNASNVSLNQPVKLVFSERIQEGVDFDQITLRSGGTSVAFKSDVDNDTLTLTSNGLGAGTSYTVKIPKAGLKDDAGQNPDSNLILTFTTTPASNNNGGSGDTGKSTGSGGGGGGGGGGGFQAVKSLALDQHKLVLNTDSAPVQLTATIEPANATDKQISWTSSDEKIATVKDGLVTPLYPGQITITVATVKNKLFTDTCTVIVRAAPAKPAQKLSVSPEKPVQSPATVGFTDVTNNQAKTAINALAQKGIVSGYSDGTFRPNQNMTRIGFTVVLVKALGIKPNNTIKLIFRDSKSIPTWARGYVAAAAKAGLLPPAWNRTLSGSDVINRTEVAYMMARAIGVKHYTSSTIINDKLPSWAVDSIKYVVDKKQMSLGPDRTFKPGQGINRWQACVLINNLMNSVANNTSKKGAGK
ncbi:MAG: Ig-like domain-containing protein [Acidobacteriota bacterium]